MRVRAAGGLKVTDETTGGDLVVSQVASIDPPDRDPIPSHRIDGTLWRRHWHEPHRLVIDFVGAVVVEVNHSAITFDREISSDAKEHIVLDHILPLWLAWRGNLVIHAGLVADGDRGVALIGRSGAGKSTLTAHLANQGWQLGGDDGIVVTGVAPPLAEATYSSIRLTDQSVALLGATEHSPIAGKHRLLTTAMSSLECPVPLRLLAFVEPAARSSATPMGAAATHAQLFGSTFHADLDPERSLPSMFEAIAGVVDAVPGVTLRVGRGIEGLEATREQLQELLRGP